MPAHIAFIRAHLQIDMTAGEMARYFRVAPQEIWRCAIDKNLPCRPGSSPIALHTPGGGNLCPGVPGATQKDAYEPMPGYFRPPTWG